jgi:hypothetical protein
MEDAGPPRSIMLTNGQHLPGGAMLGGPYHPCIFKIFKFLNFKHILNHRLFLFITYFKQFNEKPNLK